MFSGAVKNAEQTKEKDIEGHEGNDGENSVDTGRHGVEDEL